MKLIKSYTDGEVIVPASQDHPETIVREFDLAVALGCRLVRQTPATGAAGPERWRFADTREVSESIGYYNGDMRIRALARLCVGVDADREPGGDYFERVACQPTVMIMGGRTKPVNAPLTHDVPSEAAVGERQFWTEIGQLRSRFPLVDKRLGLLEAAGAGLRCLREEESQNTREGINYLVDYMVEHDDIRSLCIVTDMDHMNRTYAMLLRELHGRGMLADQRRTIMVLSGTPLLTNWLYGHEFNKQLRAVLTVPSDSMYWYRKVRLRAEAVGMLALALGTYGSGGPDPEYGEFEPGFWRQHYYLARDLSESNLSDELRQKMQRELGWYAPFDEGDSYMYSMMDNVLGGRQAALYDILEDYLRKLPEHIAPEFVPDSSQPDAKRFQAIRRAMADRFWESGTLFKYGSRTWPQEWYNNPSKDPSLAATNFLNLWLHGFDKFETFEPTEP